VAGFAAALALLGLVLLITVGLRTAAELLAGVTYAWREGALRWA
jgi:hypothetical protein